MAHGAAKVKVMIVRNDDGGMIAIASTVQFSKQGGLPGRVSTSPVTKSNIPRRTARATVLTGLIFLTTAGGLGNAARQLRADQPPNERAEVVSQNERSVVFPRDEAVGVYAIFDDVDDSPYPIHGRSLAMGEIRIPANRLISLVCDPQNLPRLGALRSHDIQHLVLCGSYTTSFGAWVKLPQIEHLTGLKALTLRGNSYSPHFGHGGSNSVREVFRQGDFKTLRKFRELKRLDLRLTQFPSKELSHVVRLPQLETLVLDQSSINDAGMVEVGRCRSLRRLSLVWTTDITAVGLSQLRQLEQLRSIDLRATEVAADGLKQLAKLPSLKELKIGPVKLDTDLLQQLERFSSLERLTLKLADTPNQSLPAFRLPSSLKHVRMERRSTLTDRSVQESLGSCKQLESLALDLPLRMEGNGLAALRKLESLRSLSLQIIEADETSMASMHSLVQLEELVVTMRDKKHGLPALMMALDGHPNLSALRVSASVKPDQPARRLAHGLPKLTRLTSFLGYNQKWASEICRDTIRPAHVAARARFTHPPYMGRSTAAF